MIEFIHINSLDLDRLDIYEIDQFIPFMQQLDWWTISSSVCKI